ncbi:MAG: Clp protease ClpP [Firmicutes bacterium]|nr:Clp protease ClpP [Bacillota bacterium]
MDKKGKKGKQAEKFWTIRNSASDEKVGEVLLYGEISNYSWWGDEVTPKQFREDLDALGDVDEIRVYINSPGGDVFAGQTIYSIIKRHSATINVYIDGLAASAASVIAMAGDKIIMPVNSMLMIHNPWTFGFGEANDFRKLADDLDQIRGSMVAAYKTKTDKDDQEIIDLLDAETWLTAAEAVEAGFADEVEESKQVAASVRGRTVVINGQEMDLTRYNKAPKFLVAAKAAGPDPTLADPDPNTSDPNPEPDPAEAKGQEDKLKLLALELELETGNPVDQTKEVD